MSTNEKNELLSGIFGDMYKPSSKDKTSDEKPKTVKNPLKRTDGKADANKLGKVYSSNESLFDDVFSDMLGSDKKGREFTEVLSDNLRKLGKDLSKAGKAGKNAGDLSGGFGGMDSFGWDKDLDAAINQTLHQLDTESGIRIDQNKPVVPGTAAGDPSNAPAFQAPTATSTGNKEPVEAAQPAEPETDPMDDLNALTGLTSIKEDVKELVNFAKAQKLRKDKGLKTVPVSLHLVFSGNPGTGKTTVARIMARLYKQIGVLSKGQLVEVDRSGLVAGYVGQTAIRTQEKIQEAMGGVLFIDEAYTLCNGGDNDFGQEAIDTILKAMEDHRDDLVVIVAGYTDLMKKFINSNPGLKSRFNKYIEFPDYTAEELMEIFNRNCKKYEYECDEEAAEAIKQHFVHITMNKGPNFANARDVRNYFEAIITNQASRVADLEDPQAEDLSKICASDLP